MSDPWTAIIDKVRPLVGKLGSTHDGEVLSAARAISRLLAAHNLSFNDLALSINAEARERIVYVERGGSGYTPTTLKEMCDYCVQRQDRLRVNEAEFVCDMARYLSWPDTELSARQESWLRSLYYKLAKHGD